MKLMSRYNDVASSASGIRSHMLAFQICYTHARTVIFPVHLRVFLHCFNNHLDHDRCVKSLTASGKGQDFPQKCPEHQPVESLSPA